MGDDVNITISKEINETDRKAAYSDSFIAVVEIIGNLQDLILLFSNVVTEDACIYTKVTPGDKSSLHITFEKSKEDPSLSVINFDIADNSVCVPSLREQVFFIDKHIVVKKNQPDFGITSNLLLCFHGITGLDNAIRDIRQRYHVNVTAKLGKVSPYSELEEVKASIN